MTRKNGDAKPKTRETNCELLLRAALERRGVSGIEVAPNDVLGKPDIVIRGGPRPVAIFVDGCYWHRCPKHATTPRSKRLFWLRKFERNQIRDRGIGWPCLHCGRMTGLLVERGWIVERVWEHDVVEDADGTAKKVMARVRAARASSMSDRGGGE